MEPREEGGRGEACRKMTAEDDEENAAENTNISTGNG